MGPDRDLIHPDESIRTNGMDYVRHCIDAAQTLGAANVVGPLYSAVGRTWQADRDERKRDLDLLVRQLRDLSAYAADRGVTLCVEPLNRFETSFLNLASQAHRGRRSRRSSKACGLLLDTFHMNIEERSIGDAIRAAGPRMRHLHTCENDRGAPGSGHVPWDEVAQACGDIGYTGSDGDRVVHEQGEIDRARRGDLALVRGVAGRARDRWASLSSPAVPELTRRARASRVMNNADRDPSGRALATGNWLLPTACRV